MLSAKHGLLDPDDVISPFDVQIDDQSAAYRTAWGEWVVAQLAERVQLDGVTVEVHGGVSTSSRPKGRWSAPSSRAATRPPC